MRISSKRSVARLAVNEAAEELGVTVDVLRERIRENTIAYESDEHGQLYVLIGAATNAPDPDRNRRKTPRDAAMIKDLQGETVEPDPGSEPPEDTGEPEAPDEPAKPF